MLSYSDWRIWIGVGVLFIILGVISIIWGKREEDKYYTGISDRFDVKEFVIHLPFRPEPGALKTGGLICIILGIVLLAAGGGIWYWGWLKPF